jgi:Bacterial SH3 domain
MKRYLLLILVCLLVIPAAYAKKYKTTEIANVREEAGTEYPALGKLKEGTIVDADDVSGKWAKITYDGQEGYIASVFLKEVPEDAVPSKEAAADANADNETTIVLVVIGFFIFLAVVKWLYDMRTGASRKARANAEKERTPKIMYWYQCEKCRATIRKESDPKPEGCTMATNHKWINLTEVGTKKYFCKKCSTAIGTKGEPVTEGCIESTQHEWHTF